MPFVYTIDWHKYLTDTFDEELRFHAAWRRENPAPAWADDFFTLDAVGRGYLLGWSLGVRPPQRRHALDAFRLRELLP